MMVEERPGALKKLLAALKKYKLVLLVPALGLVLLLLPTGSRGNAAKAAKTDDTEAVFSVEREEERLAAVLSDISGAGKVSVYLSVGESREAVVAVDEETDGADRATREVVVVSGSDGEEPVTLKYVYPEYRGAVVAAEGADSSSVRLALTQAVMAATGLGADRITVVKMN